ncbi:MAG TPA: GAF domain-containing protein, partial [Coleofasciculaceae cyanobacterium]
QQAQAQAKREQAINQVTQAIRSSLDLKTIFSTATREIVELLQVDRAKIVQYLPERKVWVHVSEYYKAPEFPITVGQEIPDENNEIAQRLKQLEIVKIDDTNTIESEVNQDLAKAFPGAWLLVPLHFGSSVWGSITLAKETSPYYWQDAEVELIRSIADQVAIAIHQSQLYAQARYHLLREQALNLLTQVIRRSLDLETIFSTATHEIGQLLQVDHVHILQYLPNRNVWVNVAESCKWGRSALGIGLEITDDHNEVTEGLKRLEVVRIEDTQSVEDEMNRRIAQQFPGAWLLVPLHFGSSVWGALGLVFDVGPYHWQESEIDLICEVADQLAIALQQAELYEQSRRATATAITQAQQLEQALQELQKTQAQLVQSEKMSSLGQLVAGVAHEINNPVNFIYGNLTHATGYTQDLLGLIELYQDQYPNPTPEIQSEMDAIDLEFLIEDLPRLLDSMKIGAERISEIVRSLRNFSRVSEAEMKAVDIHEGIDSTLMILQNRLKAQGKHPAIQVIKEYGNLPKVECYAGQLNQVFMNLLTNAIDALEEATCRETTDENEQPTNRFKPAIRIRTELLNNHQVAIWIADNGPGMSEQVRQRLFDPFFTTKPIGVGTGLGLSISYQIIVEKHGGQLLCFSELGQGTEFVIEIPLFQQNRQPRQT